MPRTPGITIPFLFALILATASGVSLAGGELTVVTTGVSGDYGTGVDSDAQWLVLRYVTGSDLQFRADLSMIRADTIESGVTYTGLGPTANGRNRSGSGDVRPSVSTQEASSTSAAGIGDLRLAVSRRVVGGGVKLFRLDASVELKVPLADEERNLGTGELDYRVGLAHEYRLWAATLFGGLGWNGLGDTALIELNDVFDAYVGLDSEPFARDRLIATGWVEGSQPAVDDAGHRAVVGVGLRTTGKQRWRLQIRRGLTESSEDLAFVAGVSFGISPGGPGVWGHQR